ncbi:MAG: hypothetical protein ABJE66_04975 [Deltaproteobacteria bacterium]
MDLRSVPHAALIVLMLACATSPKPPPPSFNKEAAGSGSACLPTTIEAYCSTRKCPTYDSAASFARQPHKDHYYYWIGTCGEYRFVRTQEGMGMGTEYFASDGKLVGSASLADAPMCTGELTNMIGVGNEGCTEQVAETGGHQ